MAKYEFGGKRPAVGDGTWVHETAQLIGDVVVGSGCFIGAGAVLRGDFGSCRVGDRSSVQESCAMHSRPGEVCSVGSDSTIGHGAVLHGCKVGDRAVVGIHCVVADGAEVGNDCIIGENSLVKAGMKIPAGSLAAGSPAVVKGPLKESQIMMKNAGAALYSELAAKYIREARRLPD